MKKISLFTMLLPLIAAMFLSGSRVHAAADSSVGADNARHLLNRTGFAATDSDIAAFAKLGRVEAADQLVKAVRSTATQAPPAWVNDPPVPAVRLRDMSQEERMAEQRKNVERAFELREWWFREMLTTPSPLTEKMTLFWHNHFATSQQKVRFTPLMYQQHVMLRRNAMGNFGTLLREVSRDPAMLVYLDGANSRKEQPNENFAREVMELFTLGEGHYTEKDIKEAARAFTGWSVDRETGHFMFRRGIHDYGNKTVLGKSGNFDGDQVIDILLAKPETAQFITRKLWKEFVSPAPAKCSVSGRQQHRRALLGNHDGRAGGIARDDVGHHRRIDHIQAGQALHPQSGVDHGQGVSRRPHAGAAHGVVDRAGPAGDCRLQRGGIVIAYRGPWCQL